MNSERLAPAGTYTSRADIPHYNLNPYSNVMQASIIESGGQPASAIAGLIAQHIGGPGNVIVEAVQPPQNFGGAVGAGNAL